jgi:hypothetical protein
MGGRSSLAGHSQSTSNFLKILSLSQRLKMRGLVTPLGLMLESMTQAMMNLFLGHASTQIGIETLLQDIPMLLPEK